MRRTLALLLALACASPAPVRAGDPVDADVLRGIALVDDGEYDEAIFVLDAAVRRLNASAIKASPETLGRAYVSLGIAYLGKGHEAAARARFREAVSHIRDLTLSPDQYPPKVIDLFESAREEALRQAPAPPPAVVSAPPPTPTTSSPAVKPPEPRQAGSRGKVLLLGVAGVAAAGVAVAAGGGGGSSTTTPPPSALNEQTISGTLANGEQRFLTVTASRAGTLHAKATWQDRQTSLTIDCQDNAPPYTPCSGSGARTNDLTFEFTAPVQQKTYLVVLSNYSSRAPEPFTLTVRYP